MARLKGVIFDADGTLLDSFRSQYGFLKEAAARFGGANPFPPFDEKFRAAYNCEIAAGQIPGVLRMCGVDYEAHASGIYRLYDEHHARSPPLPFDGIDAVTENLRGYRLKLAINTAKRATHLLPSLRNAGIAHRFDALVGYEDLESAACAEPIVARLHAPQLTRATVASRARALAKPNPYSVHLAMRKMRLAPERLVAFEDTAAGIEAYLHAGVRVYACAWGFEPAERLRDLPVQGVLKRPGEITHVVQDLL